MKSHVASTEEKHYIICNVLCDLKNPLFIFHFPVRLGQSYVWTLFHAFH